MLAKPNFNSSCKICSSNDVEEEEEAEEEETARVLPG